MNEPKSVFTAQASPPGGPYSQAVVAGDFVFTAGLLAFDETGALVGQTIAEQTAQVLKNMRTILEAAGSSLGMVVRTDAFLVAGADMPEFNRIYADTFGGHRPARATAIVSALAKGALVEIDCVALRAATD
jgi:2-iminobutanoate/2-iminopropanoate deaminase